jgi:iron-sulfur cluster assembly accessory protein
MIITDKAQEKVAELIKVSQAAMPDYSLFLRVTAVSEGNSGLKHQTYFDYEEREDDKVYEYVGFNLRIDKSSLAFLEGASIHYIESDENAGFIIDNPNS